MAKKKSKVLDRRRAQKHSTRRKSYSTGSRGAGGTMGGLRAGFRSLTRGGGRSRRQAETSGRFWNYVTYGVLAAALIFFFIRRYGC